uniref:Zinc finger protein n=1 Tax=Ciona intestinalis TaxID=7719 RepID=Q1RLC3_CIOIN|nr:zinc finger protein (TRAF/RING)-4 [Ciona intestinalis]FAA00142.1 TPA: zinc finger protein [Ciona intestinalis]|eukprot:NP_001123341.1 zinc finger protein (TRAF/RING)-4 [Ciona intestinalis]
MMSEHNLLDTPSSSTEQCKEPPTKKLKTSKSNASEKLEERLNHILSCTVCLDLPTSACMQCCHGHLMCVGCYHHLLADARLKDEQATCPSCRVDITRGTCIRNLAVEKAISELPVECRTCGGTFPRSNIVNHELHQCSERVVPCRFKQLGCYWSGPAHELDNHTTDCNQHAKSPTELLKCLDHIHSQQEKQGAVLRNIVDLLSCDLISYMEVQLRPYRTDDFVTKLFYESNRFHLLGQTWILKAYVSAVENHPSNPTVSAERRLTCQLFLKSKITDPLEVDILLLRAPYDDVNIMPKPFFTRFNAEKLETAVQPIQLTSRIGCLGQRSSI